MKIFYKQPELDLQSSLNRFGVQNCYFKGLSFDRDNKSVTKNPHHHTGFEMHIITEGFQEYEVNGRRYTLESGRFLIIYPGIRHKVIASVPHTQKYSITSDKHTEESQTCFLGTITDRIAGNLDYIFNEALLKNEISAMLIENNITARIRTASWVSQIVLLKSRRKSKNIGRGITQKVCFMKDSRGSPNLHRI